ncbi:hypothetical protein SBRCBS47491_000861 [Sporothrix bragantina]|uniref:Uncharacterized protein n=1 Tax=Sporothrix bragantina TaxID=671064 RepID=A0ABP0ATU9_9PEZI
MDHETDNDRSDFASSQGAPSSPSLSLQPEEALPAYSELDARHSNNTNKSDKRIADHIVENLDNLRMVINRLSPHGRAETADVVASLVVQSHRQAADHCAKPRSESKKGRKAAFQKAVAETEWRILYSALASKYPQQYKKLKNSFCLGCLIKNMGMWHSLHDAAFSSPKFLEAWAAANGQLLPKFARACTAVPCEATDDAANGYIDFSKDVIAEVKKR